MITRAKISVVRASECRTYSRAALINFFVPDAALIQVNTVLLVCIHSSSIMILPPYSVSKVNKVLVMTLSTSFFSFFFFFYFSMEKSVVRCQKRYFMK